MKCVAWFAGLGFWLICSTSAFAFFYGPPVPTLKAEQWGIEAAVGDITRKVREPGATEKRKFSRETAILEYGWSDSSTVWGEASAVDMGRFRGNEVAVGYRRAVGKERRIGKGEWLLRIGVFAALRFASLSQQSRTADFNQLDVGAGGVLQLIENFSLYAGGVFSRLDGISDGTDFEGERSAGFFGGGILDLDENIRMGGEIQLLNQSGLAVFLKYAF